MKNQKRYYTFLYVPAQNTGLKTVKIPKWAVWASIATVVVLIGSSAAAIIKYASRIGDTYKVIQLTSENETLRAQVSEIDHDLDHLKRQVRQNFDFQKRARLMASLEDLNEDVTEVGVGGPGAGYIQALSVLDEGTRSDVVELREDVEKLIRQAKLQAESYTEVIEVLSEPLRAPYAPDHGTLIVSLWARLLGPPGDANLRNC
jgi:outer membrane murein-binding lipoprotein Lpp